jgi:hypothetical protein
MNREKLHKSFYIKWLRENGDSRHQPSKFAATLYAVAGLNGLSHGLLKPMAVRSFGSEKRTAFPVIRAMPAANLGVRASGK